MPDPLSEARLRAQRFLYRDGLSEIVPGIIFVLQGGWLLFNHLVNSRSPWYLPLALIYILLLAAFAMSVARIRAAIRERITYPRSGYVAYDESLRKRRIRVGMALALLAIVTCMMFYTGRAGWDPNHWIQWLPAVGGLTVGAGSMYVSVRQGLVRYLVVGLLSIVLGVVVSIEYPLKLATAIWLADVGCAWLCSGGLTLWNYVRTEPPTESESDKGAGVFFGSHTSVRRSNLATSRACNTRLLSPTLAPRGVTLPDICLRSSPQSFDNRRVHDFAVNNI